VLPFSGGALVGESVLEADHYFDPCIFPLLQVSMPDVRDIPHPAARRRSSILSVFTPEAGGADKYDVDPGPNWDSCICCSIHISVT
jgi:hypothetical protein